MGDIRDSSRDRLVLRPFVPGDLAELVEVHAEESFWWYPLAAAMTTEQTAVFLTGPSSATRRTVSALRR